MATVDMMRAVDSEQKQFQEQPEAFLNFRDCCVEMKREYPDRAFVWAPVWQHFDQVQYRADPTSKDSEAQTDEACRDEKKVQKTKKAVMQGTPCLLLMVTS